jgi:hypothetical protein
MNLIEKIKGPEFIKTAGKILLGDNPSTYPSELIANLYKQHPYLGKYQVNISIEGQDASMGYMYGVFLVSMATDVPPEPGTKRMGEVVSQGSPSPDPANSVRVPIIVESKRAFSFDVFIAPDGRFLPLNEQRISSVLFEASPFSVAPQVGPTQSSSMGTEMPAGAAGRSAPLNSGTKLASVFEHISKDDVKGFVESISTQPTLKNAYDINPVFRESLHRLVAEAAEPVVEKTASAGFTSALVSKTSGGFSIKTSDHLEIGQGVVVTNEDAQNVLSVDIRQQVIKTGSALLGPSSNTGLDDISYTDGLAEADVTGVYSVMTKTGKAQRATVIKGITRVDGSSSDSCIIVGETGASFQEKVAGVRCGDVDLSIIEGQDPIGEGVFIFKTAGVVTEPVRVLHHIFDGDGTTIAYAHPLRGVGHFKVASVNKIVPVESNVQLIPEDYTFVPLEFGARYSDDAYSMDKIASRRAYINGVSVVSDGSEYSFRGAHIDEKSLSDLSHSEALLVLSDLGDTPDGAYRKLASAKNGKTPLFSASVPRKTKTASAEISNNVIALVQHIKSDLVKEASVFTNSETVDTVLSLNFITPENVAGYVDSIPVLDEAGSKLAELLVGVRLGLSDIPESAVSSALTGMERAIKGLKKLQIRSNMVE